MDPQFIANVVTKSIFNNKDTTLVSHKKIHTPSSLVLRLEYLLGEQSKVLFVKMPAEDKNSRQTTMIIQRLKREFQLAERVKSSFAATTQLEVVSPAGYINEINGFLTWEVQGDCLQDIINRKLRFQYWQEITELERLSNLSGQWLHRFHSMDIIDNHFKLSEDISEYCNGRLDALVKIKNSRISKELSQTLKNRIAEWINQSLSAPDVKIVMCHNDFSPHNIVVTDKGICVLDFSYSTPGLPAFDLACFWHKIEDLKWSPLRGNKGLEAIQKHFLEAYETDFDITRPDIKLGLMRLILSKMLTLLNARNTWGYRRFENQQRYRSYLNFLESGFIK